MIKTKKSFFFQPKFQWKNIQNWLLFKRTRCHQGLRTVFFRWWWPITKVESRVQVQLYIQMVLLNCIETCTLLTTFSRMMWSIFIHAHMRERMEFIDGAPKCNNPFSFFTPFLAHVIWGKNRQTHEKIMAHPESTMDDSWNSN